MLGCTGLHVLLNKHWHEPSLNAQDGLPFIRLKQPNYLTIYP